MKEIEELKNCFIEKLAPVRIYLFGSFAEGRQTEDSDFDFYIVVDDYMKNIIAETQRAYKSIRDIKKRSVDIVVGSRKRFEERKTIPSLESEVDKKGVLLYAR